MSMGMSKYTPLVNEWINTFSGIGGAEVFVVVYACNNFVIKWVVECMSNGGTCLIEYMYSHRQWALRFGAVFKIWL